MAKYTVDWDNAFAAARRDSATGGCKAGFVVRAAVPGDGACVPPSSRNEVEQQNNWVGFGWVNTSDRKIFDNYTVLHPFNAEFDVYTIGSSYTGSAALVADVPNAADGTQLVVWKRWLGDNQKFQFRAPRTRNGSVFQNSFDIVAKHTGKCLDVWGFGTGDGTKVVQWPCTGNTNQKWYLSRRSDNEWEIRSLQSDKCLDAQNPSLSAPQQGAPLQIWSCNGGRNQAWHLRSAGSV